VTSKSCLSASLHVAHTTKIGSATHDRHCVCACVYVCVRVCVRVCMCVRVCALEAKPEPLIHAQLNKHDNFPSQFHTIIRDDAGLSLFAVCGSACAWPVTPSLLLAPCHRFQAEQCPVSS